MSVGYTVYGAADCPYFARAERLALTLRQYLGATPTDVVAEFVDPSKFQQLTDDIAQRLGCQEQWSSARLSEEGSVFAFNHKTGRFVGGERSFRKEVEQKYGLRPDLSRPLMRAIAKENEFLFKQLEKSKAQRKQEREKASLHIIVAGAPASGKGTQCALLQEKYGVVQVSTGDLLREQVKQGTRLGQTARQYMDRGLLVPDELVIDMVKNRLQDRDCTDRGWLLDGFPRTHDQAKSLSDAGIKPDLFVLIDVSDRELLSRILGRRLDPETGEIYHTEFKPATDPKVAARLIQRSDDTSESAKVRIATYHKHISDVSGEYEDQMASVDGSQSPPDVFKQIEKHIQDWRAGEKFF